MPTGTKPPPGPVTRVLGAILSRSLRRNELTQLELADRLSISKGQMNKMLRGRAHIDIDQFIGMCAEQGLDPAEVLREAIQEASPGAADSPSADDTETPISPTELGRRLNLLVAYLADSSSAAGLRQVRPALSRSGLTLSFDEWEHLLHGDGPVDSPSLAAIADGLGVPTGYLTRLDESLAKRVESDLLRARTSRQAGAAPAQPDDHALLEMVQARLAFDEQMKKLGVEHVAARTLGPLEPDELAGIASAISRILAELRSP
ncbi:hypothetical protein C5C31_09240 [Rathayibacter rathayi]|uniref:helix-turn-helix domain-containing protein n=1 Tax=Rathayibacter rathayi TaxID=33887 RepID=UPI000CE82599|nr:helix-turn-helix transcriptional regulator [Rathayibacter rathayi]PPG67575.1 hypothetical protein C5C02_09480 [Rathayibacter rathayi]PPG76562.1 hypothetical protein C5C23_07485 [Rathayibacter rathayi]PPH22250.1 hypothetical protein C5C31_09240 [Rathayibacter rathayi]PPH36998.1 hypothetical protein C5C28_04835 [Rathayibacter rathayi]PPH64288.1 hypothetical protein C5C45_12880 [Rathayibacter rathayi]